MTRQQKYPDTQFFHYYNANSKGRFTSDCVVRAISTATMIPYEKVVSDLSALQIKTGYDTSDPKLFDMYLRGKGWIKRKQPRKTDGKKFTGEEFCRKLQDAYDCDSGIWSSMNGRYIANIGGNHTVAIINGQVYDTWDSTGGCIGNYWTDGRFK